MVPEVLARAFDPFFTTKGVGEGSGLGLSMVLGNMEQLGGTARIFSEVGHGATVRLYLPRAASDPVGMTDSPPHLIGQTSRQRILVVEDNALVRSSVTEMLRSLGYEAVEDESAASALARWERGERFDLIFTDILLPGMLSGVGLACQLRARDPNARILLTSGFANWDQYRSEIEALGLSVLVKPYRKTLLAERVGAALEGAG
jgi:CheY-like chemotaxis protein